ncbi:hypothetical protein [Nitratireductor soli]|uniref:hypothetical protein n=1 Tax=Nitratireductor soli TaxID=1670619 RepID=UPI001FCE10BF|nr:hypothetical protein [Nitratireductor soli]
MTNAPAAPNPRFMLRIFQVSVILLFISLGIAAAGKWLGGSMAAAGHSEATQIHEIVIGNNVLAVPENAIRFEGARRSGIARRLDLYLRWPELGGYTRATRDDFNHVDGARRIIFLTFEERVMSRDMSGRLEPIYAHVINAKSIAGPNGIRFYGFKPEAGYRGEALAVADGKAGERPFVARCLSGVAARESLAPCERDIAIGDDMSLTYRFPAELLGDWPVLDAAVTGRAKIYLQTLR